MGLRGSQGNDAQSGMFHSVKRCRALLELSFTLKYCTPGLQTKTRALVFFKEDVVLHYILHGAWELPAFNLLLERKEKSGKHAPFSLRLQ